MSTVPSLERFQEIEKDFFERWNMPNCIGAVDGKHVHIQAPKYSGSEYFNHKKSFSLVLLAVCDAKYRLTMVDIGAAGCNHDSTVFKNSCLGMAFMNGGIEIPPPKCLPNSTTRLNHFIVADQAFPLSKSIMRPYPGRDLSVTKRVFNYRLSRARRTIENAFGILVQRWRLLRKPIIANISTCENIVKATVVLRNFLMDDEEQQGFTNTSKVHPLRPVGRLGSNNPQKIHQEARDVLAEYFVSPSGVFPHQWDAIQVGSQPCN